MRATRSSVGPILAFAMIAACGGAAASEVAPLEVLSKRAIEGPAVGVFSERTLVVGIEVDRDEARVVGYTAKDRPYVRALEAPPSRTYREGHGVQIEVVLHGENGRRHTRRVDVGPLCFDHGAGAESHIAGDTILLHRDSFVVELPEIAGVDRVEVAYYEPDRGGKRRRTVGDDELARQKYRTAGTPIGYSDLAFARPTVGEAPGEPPAPQASTPLWPEDFADPELYRVDGDETEVGQRINIVIVPDGYTYAQKSLMESHADQMIAHFRALTPYKEHDPFINYILVYAYSVESGTDECDCSTIRDTHMGTRFPNAVPTCGDSANRCLYYGPGCDGFEESNIVAAELRAPAQDTTLVMVNTGRWGGCGGTRGVFAGAHPSGDTIASHELGHSLANLADEYEGNTGCNAVAGEINTSTDPVNGAWPEWVDDLGGPREGGQYWSECVFRPQTSCHMRSSFDPFCAVCNQRWALVIFGSAGVGLTAPLASATPGAFPSISPGEQIDFEITTRFAQGPDVQNQINWRIEGPGIPDPVVVAQDVEQYSRVFPDEGVFKVTAEVIADMNFIKPTRYESNVDTALWTINVSTAQLPSEVSGPGALTPLRFFDRETVFWENAGGLGVATYNLYRGDVTGLASGNYGSCLQSGLTLNVATEATAPPAGTGWTYLVTGVNAAGEGSMGQSSGGTARNVPVPCP